MRHRSAHSHLHNPLILGDFLLWISESAHENLHFPTPLMHGGRDLLNWRSNYRCRGVALLAKPAHLVHC